MILSFLSALLSLYSSESSGNREVMDSTIRHNNSYYHFDINTSLSLAKNIYCTQQTLTFHLLIVPLDSEL